MKRSKKFSDLRKEIKQKCPNFKTMEEIKALAKQSYDKGNCAIAMYVLFGDTTPLPEILDCLTPILIQLIVDCLLPQKEKSSGLP
jgi:hypothetical protein